MQSRAHGHVIQQARKGAGVIEFVGVAVGLVAEAEVAQAFFAKGAFLAGRALRPRAWKRLGNRGQCGARSTGCAADGKARGRQQGVGREQHGYAGLAGDTLDDGGHRITAREAEGHLTHRIRQGRLAGEGHGACGNRQACVLDRIGRARLGRHQFGA
ncbi:hypothetical protein BTM36_22695 [Herbaspirillum sp. VT-16-41]|nr:hypothetical protein BTM36_22695 [Herbaspirillum sp. VT-16-41]